MPDDPRTDVAEALLELRDEIIGIQAQLDELRARIDELAAGDGSTPGLLARVRSRIARES
jgi:hypothetical protein